MFLESSGICTDTRKITKNCFFVCLKGDNFNGNTFAEEALKAGAQTVVIDEADYAHLPGTLLVEDGLKYIQELANHHRKQFSIPVIGITGSNGKTTTKELLHAVLSSHFNVHCTAGNFNNHLGVPLTLLGLKGAHELAIVEMGANKFKDIEELSLIAEPNHGLITNIGSAHLEGFGSFEGILKTKKELYEFVDSVNGHLFYNADDDVLKSVLPKGVTVSTYGKDQGELTGNLVRLTPFVELEYQYKDYTSPLLQSNLVGEYNFYNFLAAICTGIHFEVPFEKINQAISAYQPTNNRSQVIRTERNTLIVDCYNANPSSMSSAIKSFAAIDHSEKIMILGDMRELGDYSRDAHAQIVQEIESLKLSAIYVGLEFQKVLSAGAEWYESAIALKESNQLADKSDALVLLKGSRGIRLEQVIEEL